MLPASAKLASCGHLRLCKLPWMQVGFLGLRAFSSLCQSVDFVNILGRKPFRTSSPFPCKIARSGNAPDRALLIEDARLPYLPRRPHVFQHFPGLAERLRHGNDAPARRIRLGSGKGAHERPFRPPPGRAFRLAWAGRRMNVSHARRLLSPVTAIVPKTTGASQAPHPAQSKTTFRLLCRRQAPARGPAAVYSLYRTIRNETQNARPLLVGRAFVDLEPTATGRPHCGHSRILVTTPEPTVRPPSRMAKRRPSSHAIGVISVISMSMLSPGMTISTPSGSLMLPVTSVVRK